MYKHAPVHDDCKFSMTDIAKAFNVNPIFQRGISYGVLKLQIPLNNGTFVEFRQGDDETDNEVKIYPLDMMTKEL